MIVTIGHPEGMKLIEETLTNKTSKPWKCVGKRGDLVLKVPTRLACWLEGLDAKTMSEAIYSRFGDGNVEDFGSMYKPNVYFDWESKTSICFAEVDSELVKRMFGVQEVSRKIQL